MKQTVNKNKQMAGCLCALGCSVIYGLSYIFTKQATNIGSPLTLLSWRFSIAFVVMTLCIITGFIKINLKGKNFVPVIIVALFNPLIYFIAETIGISYTTASESGSFLACIPIASLLASTLILKKKPNKHQIIGISITLAGVLMTVFAVGMNTSFSLIGYTMLLTAVISYALYGVFVEKASEFTGTEITYIMLLAGAVFFDTCAVAESLINGNVNTLLAFPFMNLDFLLAVLYQGIGCSVLAFIMSNIAIVNIGINRVVSFAGVSTVVSIAAGIILLKESFSIWQIIGVILIIIGVYISNLQKEILRRG